MDSVKKNYAILPDVLGIAFCALGVLVGFSLLSFSSADNGIYAYGSYRIQNWIGPGGALIANLFYTLFGFLAIALPFLFFAAGMASFWRRPIWHKPTKIIGSVLLVVAASIILEEVSTGTFGVSFPWGGLLGYGLHRALISVISQLGMWLVSLTLFLVGVVLWIEGLRMPRRVSPESPAVSIPPPVVMKPMVAAVSSLPPAAPSAPGSLQIIERQVEAFDNVETPKVSQNFELPGIKLLDYDAPPPIQLDERLMRAQAERLEKTFMQFGIEGQVREIRPGPVVTCFEFVPAPGIKLSKIAVLADDIAMAMTAVHVRIVAPIPGKGAVGIEIPNDQRETVYLKEIVGHPSYREHPHKLCMALGKTIEGKPYFVNLADMPHVLMAGTTGSGKSVSVNAMICSILYRATPDEVRFLMIDPKMLELGIYEGIPHLLLPPIIDSKKAAQALKWAVREMDNRYLKMNEIGVRDITGYNEKVDSTQKMPFIVVVVDEYADLVAVAGKDVEALVMRLAQKARAAGIHVMLATQRPSVDIITGVIKANFPVRMSFRLASSYDSKTIINRSGAEKLLGRGDMLLMPPGTSEVIRVHGAYVSEKELSRVVDFWKSQCKPEYDMTIAEAPPEEALTGEDGVFEGGDDKYQEAIEVVRRTQKCSTSWIQRQLGVGYNRAAKMVEQMERDGHVGPIMSAKGDREIFLG
ncbi:MAG: DNA translocase FtsK 4TM domain-containing protein [Myxococcota bacterium]